MGSQFSVRVQTGFLGNGAGPAIVKQSTCSGKRPIEYISNTLHTLRVDKFQRYTFPLSVALPCGLGETEVGRRVALNH